MTVKDLKDLIVECLNESDVPIGGLVGRVKLAGFKVNEPDSALQSELDALAKRYENYLEIITFGYKDSIKLNSLKAKKDAPIGTGSSYMRDLIQLADNKGLMITLTPAVKGYGGHGFKKTSSYQRLVDFYKRFGFKSKYSKSSYRPDLSDVMFREPKKLNERNTKVSNYVYHGFTQKQE